MSNLWGTNAVIVPLDVQNLTQQIIELFKLDSIKFESIKN